MTVIMENVRTTDDRCYVGMTRENALQEGKRTLKLFSKLDDGDGILSFDEIMQQRTQKENGMKFRRNIWGGVTLTQCIGGIALEHKTPSASKLERITQLICTLIFAGITLGRHSKMKKLQKQNAEYRKQYQELLKQEEQNNTTKEIEKEIEQIQEIQKDDEEQHEIEEVA